MYICICLGIRHRTQALSHVIRGLYAGNTEIVRFKRETATT